MAILGSSFKLSEKDEARDFFNTLRQNFVDMNYSVFESPEFKTQEKKIDDVLAQKEAVVSDKVKALIKDGE